MSVNRIKRKKMRGCFVLSLILRGKAEEQGGAGGAGGAGPGALLAHKSQQRMEWNSLKLR